MFKKLLSGILVGYLTLSVVVAQDEEPPLDVKYNTSVVTPHVKWANPYYKGKLKVFMVFGHLQNRNVIEVAQRLGCEFDTVTLISGAGNIAFGLGGPELYTKRTEEDMKRGVALRIEKGGYDVIVLGGGSYKEYFAGVEGKLIKQVMESGVGIVQMDMEKMSPKTAAILPFDRVVGSSKGIEKWELLDNSSYIVSGLPVNQMSSRVRGYIGANAQVGGKVLINGGVDPKDNASFPLLVTGQAGKGRVVGIAGMEDSETSWQMLTKAILWAAKKEPELSVTSVTTDKKLYDYFETSKGKVVLAYKADGAFKDLNADLYIETAFIGNAKVSGGMLSFSLPKGLKVGVHDANIVIKDGTGVVNSGTARFTVSSGFKNASIEISNKINNLTMVPTLKYGETIKGKTKVTASPELKVYTELWDTYGRVLARIPVSTSFEFETKEIMRSKGLVKIVGYDAEGNIVDEKSAGFLVGLPDSEKVWDDWEILTYTSQAQGDERNKRIGECEPWDAGGGPNGGLFGLADYNIRQMPAHMVINGVTEVSVGAWDKIVNEVKAAKNKRKKLIRIPCINSEKFDDMIDAVVPKYGKVYSILGSLGGNGYINGDEQSYTSYTKPMDYCFSDACMKEFRTWLKTQYSSIIDLNQEWNTSFSTFEEVDPPLTEEVQADLSKTAGWNDHRIFNNLTFAKGFNKIFERLSKEDPLAKIGISGTQSPSVFGGYDWEQLSKIFGIQQSYWGLAAGIKRSVNRSMKDAPWGGYGDSYESMQYNCWKYLFNDVAGVSYYDAVSAINPDLTFNPAWKAMTDIKALFRKRGISKALQAADRPHDGVAIYFSQVSLNASFLANERYNENWKEVCDLLENAGWQYNFITPNMVKAGELQSKNYKLLFMPNAISVSKEEGDLLRSWVNNGGSIYCDGKVATRDGHAKLYKDGSIFADMLDKNSSGTYGMKKIGKGYVFYQGENFTKVNRKSFIMHKDFIAFFNEFKADIIGKTGVKPPYTLSDPAGKPIYRTELYRYESGPIKYVGVVQESNKSVDKIRKFKITLDNIYNVYDMKKGVFVGAASAILDEVEQTSGCIYALLPYQVGAVNIKTSPKVKAGSQISVAFTVAGSKGEKVGNHVVNVSAYDASGKKLLGVDKNILTSAGSGSHSFFVPYNQKQGDIKIECIDGQTGVKNSAVVKLE